jgi:hypothetical protein
MICSNAQSVKTVPLQSVRQAEAATDRDDSPIKPLRRATGRSAA